MKLPDGDCSYSMQIRSDAKRAAHVQCRSSSPTHKMKASLHRTSSLVRITGSPPGCIFLATRTSSPLLTGGGPCSKGCVKRRGGWQFWGLRVECLSHCSQLQPSTPVVPTPLPRQLWEGKSTSPRSKKRWPTRWRAT